jgi:REP element-mobilizing transposase RayT
MENQNTVHFLTITAVEWIDIFTKPEYFKIIADSLTFCRKNKGLLLFDFVIMTNHLHLLAKAKEEAKLSSIIQDFKRHTSREILKQLANDNRRYILNLIKNSFKRKSGVDRQLWQRENYPVPIISEKFYFEKARYILNNPIRKGYVRQPEDWVYSSAKYRLYNQPSIIGLDDPLT